MGMNEVTENGSSFLGLITRYNRVQRPVYTHTCVQSFSCDTDGMNTDPPNVLKFVALLSLLKRSVQRGVSNFCKDAAP